MKTSDWIERLGRVALWVTIVITALLGIWAVLATVMEEQ